MNKNSYTAASTFPLKVALNSDLVKSIEQRGEVTPVHSQIMLTNKCNLKCSFCSYDERDKSLQIDFDRIRTGLSKLKRLGCQAITISGGGEPLMYPQINEFVHFAHGEQIDVGLVSNGILLERMTARALSELTWMRISFDDNREFNQDFIEGVDYAVSSGGEIDMAFSYVLSSYPNYKNIVRLVEYANENNFTHVRMVTDIFNPSSEAMSSVKGFMKEKGVDDSKVIYQDRSSFTKGASRCLISLLKPVIDTTGNIMPCCGTSYARPNAIKGFDESFSMGAVEDIEDIIQNQKYFDGTNCEKCYYDEYNEMLDGLLSGVKHKPFV